MLKCRWIAAGLLLAICLSCFTLPALAADEPYQKTILQAAQAEKTLTGTQSDTLLSDQQACPAGSSFCDWAAIAYRLAGVNDDYDGYLKALEEYITAQYANTALLQLTGPTDRQRMAITVSVLGADPTAFGTNPDGTLVNLLADATYAYAGEFANETPNALAFALIALDCKNYDVPAGSRYTRQDLQQLLLQMQNEDGGFGLTDEASNPDVTAMVLQALAPYQGETEIESCINAALVYLSAQLDANAAVIAEGSASAEGTAQLIIALCALNIDPSTDPRFCKDNSSLPQALLTFQMEDGGFCHTLEDGMSNVMSTQQAMLAFTALEKLEKEQGRLYDFTSMTVQSEQPSYIWLYALLAVSVIVLAIILVRKQKRGKRHE